MTQPKSIQRQPMIGSFDEIVTVQEFNPDFEHLLEGVVLQLAVPENETPDALYLNPLFKVECELPTLEFFAEADIARAEWCRRAKQVLGRQSTRSTDTWTAGHLMLNEETNFWHRAACLTGPMFISGRFVSACRWDAKGLKYTTYRDKRAISRQEVFEILFDLTSPKYWQTRFAEAGIAT